MNRNSNILAVILFSAALAGLVVSCGGRKHFRSQYSDPYPGVASPKLLLLPVGAVKPQGWLQTTLRISADGITGHLQEYRSDSMWRTWDDRAYRGKLQLMKSGNLSHEVWWPYEQ